jgi:hypothetical protein
MTIKVVDHGYDKYKKAIIELNSNKIQVGLFAEVGDEVLTKGIVNEFGTNKAGKNKNITIPERSFIRSTYNKQFKKVSKRFGQVFTSISNRQYNVKEKLKLIGIEQEAATKQTITDMKAPENSESTITKKGSSHPLIDTGELRSKISNIVKKK